MTEEIAATPGWVEQRVEELFATLPGDPEVTAARESYLACLARLKQPAAPSDLLGNEFESCRAALQKKLQDLGLDTDALQQQLEALESEIAEES